MYLETSAVILLLLALAECVSDLLSGLHIWDGPGFFTSLHNAFGFLEVVVPLSLAGGAVATVRTLLVRGRSGLGSQHDEGHRVG